MYILRLLIIGVSFVFSIKATITSPALVDSTVKTTTEALTTIKTTTKSKPVNDCPHGWIYAGKLGCVYFNTNSDKVLRVVLIMA